PAEGLGTFLEPSECEWRAAAVAVTEGKIEEQQWDTGGQQGDDVGDQEGTTAIVVGNVGESPDVAQSDGGTDGREHEDIAGRENLAALGAALGRPNSLLGWRRHR